MEKSKIIILVIGIIALLALVVGLVVADSKNSTIFTIGKTSYDLEDFKSYGKVWYYEENSSLTDDLDNMLNQYSVYKLLYKRATEAGVTLEESELPAELESGDELKLMQDYELTSGEYMRVQTEMALANKLYQNAYELGKVDKDVDQWYTSYLNYYPDYLSQTYGVSLKTGESLDDYFKTVDYRVFKIAIPTSGDDELSGDAVAPETSGDISGDSAEDKKAQNILNTKLIAQNVIAKIKEDINNGLPVEDAFKLANERDYEVKTRYSASLSSLENGELDTSSRLYAYNQIQNSYLGLWGLEDSDVVSGMVNAINTFEKGQFSDLIETEDCIAFIYVEDVRDGLEGDELTQFKNEASIRYIFDSTDHSPLNMVVARKANFDQLPAVVAKKQAEEAENQEESTDSTEETVDAVSGEELIAEPTVEATEGEEVTE